MHVVLTKKICIIKLIFLETHRNIYVDRQAASAGVGYYYPHGSVFVMPGCNLYVFEGREGVPPAYVDIRYI